MEFKLSDEQLRDLVVDALFTKIDPETVKAMITDALKTLMKPQEGTAYNRTPSPSRLQEAMQGALLKIATEAAKAHFDKDEIKDQVTAMIHEATHRVIVVDREKTVESMADAFTKAFDKALTTLNSGRYA